MWAWHVWYTQVPDAGGPCEPRAVPGGLTGADHAHVVQLGGLPGALARLASGGAHGRAAFGASRRRGCGGGLAAVPRRARGASAAARDARRAGRLGSRALLGRRLHRGLRANLHHLLAPGARPPAPAPTPAPPFPPLRLFYCGLRGNTVGVESKAWVGVHCDR